MDYQMDYQRLSLRLSFPALASRDIVIVVLDKSVKIKWLLLLLLLLVVVVVVMVVVVVVVVS